ncbi:MAG TPA: ABC transporter permease [Gammaproteobacteria bacterium]|nr:ABC transporter permease [Gammaproteobacteria bacterium]
MSAYLLRRLLYALPILLGVNVITFVLFFVVNTPDDMARMQLGDRHLTQEAIDKWKAARGYDRPLFWNGAADGVAQATDTLFVTSTLRLFTFDFGISDGGRDIGSDLRQRMGPSLAIAVPVLLLQLVLALVWALLVAWLRGSRLDVASALICVAMMSISGLFYIIGGQYLVAKLWRLVPISGYDYGLASFKFLLLPVLIGMLIALGPNVRWYRTIFLEEMGREYVRMARAKGLSDARVLFAHVLRNALIPILTGVVVLLPSLFLGALITEAFFAIPGLGSYTIDALQAQDFAIVRTMVFLGSLLYILGLLLTDLSYVVADPRVRLE